MPKAAALPITDRRAVLAGLLSASAMTAAGVASYVASEDDVTAYCTEYLRIYEVLDDHPAAYYVDAPQHLHEDQVRLCKRLSDLFLKITESPARSIAAQRAKARVLMRSRGFPVDVTSTDGDDALIFSLCRDLLQEIV